MPEAARGPESRRTILALGRDGIGKRQIAGFLLSLPERLFRSTAALAGGLVREIGDVALPAALRQTRLYQALVGVTLRFLIEQVGGVEGTYPSEGHCAAEFLLRRAPGCRIAFGGIAR